MKSKKYRLLFILFILFMLLATPKSAFAISYTNDIEVSSLININAIIESVAIINDTTNIANLNIIIFGMILLILILVGTIMFASKK